MHQRLRLAVARVEHAAREHGRAAAHVAFALGAAQHQHLDAALLAGRAAGSAMRRALRASANVAS
jgi:hypothetical protein